MKVSDTKRRGNDMNEHHDTPAVRQPTSIERLKIALDADTVREQFRNALEKNAPAFVASVIDLYGSDTNLQKCAPSAVIMECLKAATLKLPINKNLGFAYIIPYGTTPNFQLGYKGYIQLAQRTGQYAIMNADIVYEGETVTKDKLTGKAMFGGEAKSDKPIGYFAHMRLHNGFEKTIYMTKEEMIAHGKKFSKAYKKKDAPWRTMFDSMALKTCIRIMLTKWGIMSVDMATALSTDNEDAVQAEVDENANKYALDITDDQKPEKPKRAPRKKKDEPKAEKKSKPGEPSEEELKADAEASAKKGPGY